MKPVHLWPLPVLGLMALLAPLVAVGQPGPGAQAESLPPELSQPSPAVDRRTWNLTPLDIVLPVGKERLVTFNAPVQVEMPAKLDAQTLRTQIVADTGSGTIYWTAQKAFERQRIQVKNLANNAFYLVDLMASPQAQDTTRIEIAVPPAPDQTEAPPAGQAVQAPPVPATPAPSPDPVALTRMAAQFCYAPERLIQPVDGVARSSASGETTVDLLHGAKVEATPLIAWRSGDLVVTAVKIKNLTPADLILDPRQLRGAWLTATFQHNLLKPAGDKRDTTALYLVSHASFDRSLHGH